jgi:hypothetical protein
VAARARVRGESEQENAECLVRRSACARVYVRGGTHLKVGSPQGVRSMSTAATAVSSGLIESTAAAACATAASVAGPLAPAATAGSFATVPGAVPAVR